MIGDEAAARRTLERIITGTATGVRDLDRVYAAESLTDLGETTRSLDLLRQLGRDGAVDGYARATAADYLMELGEATDGLEILHAVAQNPEIDGFGRADAARQLAQVGLPIGMQILRELANQPGDSGSWWAARNLAELGDRDGQPCSRSARIASAVGTRKRCWPSWTSG